MTTLPSGGSVLVTDSRAVSESSQSAVSWGAVIGGATVAAAVSLLLVALGAGFDLASISPWSGNGATATTFAVMTAIWFIVTQWVASGLGGYLTGRLRTKWVNTHTHEVFFRDTAHGFVTWALATVLTAAVLTSAAASLVAGGVPTALASGAVAGNAPAGAAAGSYDLDLLFRGGAAEANSSASSAVDPRGEVMRIMANGLAHSGVPAADRSYLAGLVAARTGVSHVDAKQRVDTFITHSKTAADSMRKVASATAVFTAISMLIGAFIACVAAALGGRRRDDEVAAAR